MTAIFLDSRVDGSGNVDPQSVEHAAVLLISRDAEIVSGAIPDDIPAVRDGSIPEDYYGFYLSRWQLHLPLAQTPEPVAHAAEETISAKEPPGKEACAVMSDFSSLSRVPNLNVLTKTRFNTRNLATPAPALVQSRVLLSGGYLRGVKSGKNLGEGFFEFYGPKGTVAIQPAVEDVAFDIDSADGRVEIGFSRLDDSTTPKIYTCVLRAAGEKGIVVQSFPKAGSSHHMAHGVPQPTLAHFAMYYALMMPREGLKPKEKPRLRMIARCDGGELVHTAPPEGGVPFFPARDHSHSPMARRTSQEGCTCFCSQVFTD